MSIECIIPNKWFLLKTWIINTTLIPQIRMIYKHHFLTRQFQFIKFFQIIKSCPILLTKLENQIFPINSLYTPSPFVQYLLFCSIMNKNNFYISQFTNNIISIPIVYNLLTMHCLRKRD